MSDAIHHECGIALLRLRKPLGHYLEKHGTALYGLNKMVLMMEKQHKTLLENKVEYIGSVDATILGSRSGQAPIYMNYILKKNKDKYEEMIYQCLYVSRWLVNRLKSYGVDAWINRNSMTVIFPKPNADIISKWSLATQGDVSHIICMPHLTIETLDEFIEEYRKQ